MNTFVVDPDWHWWILGYFFLGGLAAGSYAIASLADLVGDEFDRRLARNGYLLAAPLIGVCGVFLILDLDAPLRFWHMLLDHDTLRPHLKFWSPMSIGAWAVLAFSLLSTVSFLGVLFESGRWRTRRLRLWLRAFHRGRTGVGFKLAGAFCGFFVASYTGVLLTATNQPVWSDSPWIGGLFLASSANTGMAAMRLLAAWRATPWVAADGLLAAGEAQREFGQRSAIGKLGRIEWSGLALEGALAVLFLASLGMANVQRLAELGLWIPFLIGAMGLGIVMPIALHLSARFHRRNPAQTIAVSILLGGLFLRYSILIAPTAVLKGGW